MVGIPQLLVSRGEGPHDWPEVMRMRSLGANVGATRANNFPRQADGYGQADGGHPSSRAGPDDTERLTGIYGSDVAHSA